MGLAQDFREQYNGIQFYLVENSGGVARFKSDYIVVPETEIEVFVQIITSLKNHYFLPTQIFIQDIYNCSTRIHNIEQFENVPVKTHIIFDYAYEQGL